jgi:hypothetical protein
MNKRAGTSLISVIASVAIIAVLAVVLLMGSGALRGEPASNRADGLGKTIPGAAKAAAQDTECRSNLGQVRQAIQLRLTLDEDPPQSLEETRLGSNFYRCPLGKEPYEYNPQTAQVKCPHPGHEKF